jgi:hypothetical protein
MFRFLRSLHIVFQSGCTTLHSLQQWIPFSPHPHQRLLVVVLLILAILTGVRWNLSVVLMFISFMARDGEHFSCVLFFSIWISFFEKVLFHSDADLIGSLIWGEFSFLNSLCTLVISP